jgi:DNA primase
MSDFDLVKSQVDIVSYIQTNVSLKKAGSVYRALCPFHAEKTPSFTVNPKTQQWKCWGACGVGGSVIDFAMKYHHMTESEALQDVASFANIQLTPLNREKADKKERLYALMEAATEIYQGILFGITGKPYLKYLQEDRGLSIETIKAARIGYAPPGGIDVIKGFTHQDMVDVGMIVVPDEGAPYQRFWSRIMIPIRDHKGRVVAFTGRATTANKTKYMHNATTDIFEKSKIIHRMPLNQSTIGFKAFDTIIVVEGTIDPLTGANAGFHNIASQMGTSLSDEQLDILCKGETKRLIFCLDNDAAGDTALRRLVEKHIHRAAAKGVALYAMTAPYGKDADDTLREHPEMWQGAVDAARPVVEVLVTREFKKLGDQATGAEKSNLARELLPILRSDDPFIQQENIAILSRQTDLPIDTLEAWLIGQSKIRVLPKIVLPTTQEPPLETSILWGIIFNAHDGWLQRANAALIRLSPLDKPLLYAFAPLNALDFTHAPYQDLMGKVASGLDELEQTVINTHLESVYRRVMFAPPVTSMFKADMPDEQPRETCDEFIDNVLLLRLNRLKADMVARKNFGEVMRGMALIQQKREIQIGG